MFKWRYWYTFFPLQSAALLWVLVPFLRQNNLLEWDFPGHYTSIWHIKNQLFPWTVGWNPLFYCGYPQGIFYPPLGHYLAVLLSFGIGIAASIKLLVALSLLILPITFYSFARRCGLDELQAGVCSTWMTAILFLSGTLFGTWTFGSDLRSILNVGLFSNALSLPVLFAFMASYGIGTERRQWKLPALLLGLLLLLHPFSSLIAGLFILSLACTRLWPSAAPVSGWKPLLLPLGVALLLAASWILPFAAYRSFINTEFTQAQWSTALQFVVLNGTILALASFSKPRVRPVALAYLILSNFILVGTLWKLDLQFTRLSIYLLFLIPAFVLVWIRSRLILGVITVIACGVGLYGYRHSGLNPAGVAEFSMPDLGPLPGRVLAVAPPSHLPSFHVNHELVPLRTGNASTLGLFIESSLNGRFMGNLMRSIDPDSYVWGTPTEAVNPEVLGSEFPDWIRDRMRLFNIQHVYTDLKLEDILDQSLALNKRYCNSYPIPALENAGEIESLCRRYHCREGYLDFYLYHVGTTALLEPLPYVPVSPGSDWKLTNIRWFLELKGVPVFTDRAPPAGVRAAQMHESVEVLEVSPNMDRIVFEIRADQDIPVLAKIGYFPSWRLSLNGRYAPVHRASPNLMLIFGHGKGILEFKRPFLFYVGLVISIAGLALLVFL